MVSINADQPMRQVSCAVITDHGGESCGWEHLEKFGPRRHSIAVPIPKWFYNLIRSHLGA